MDGLVGRGRGIEPSTVCVRSEPLTTAPHAPPRPRPLSLDMHSLLSDWAGVRRTINTTKQRNSGDGHKSH
ncbi:hypothetical protein Y032_0023g773 [Ancylostoma ceylanicum]|uniref:Uncharacterized protein n=1 Tax=Ancylostoma ceylanicum TaxID=53326 RepID=A0A016UYN0_9BILA|nr:hypothetical protein Y032_0023g773 [Ancylostoma ceylanicum]